MQTNAAIYHDISKILYTRDEIQQAIRAMGERITADYQGCAPVMICILKGASVFFSDLIREVDLPLEIDYMAISSYGNATKSTGEVRMIKDLDAPILNRDVLIVEDIVDSGMTMSYLKQALAGRGARSIRIVSLMDKPARRRVPLKVDYACFEVPDVFIVGYGLDYAQKYRNLPDIGILDESVYAKAP